MEVNQEKMDNPMTKSIRDSNGQSSTTVVNEENDKPTKFLDDDRKSDQSLFDIIKSRPKRPNRKVPSRLKSTTDKVNIVNEESTSVDEKRPNPLRTQSTVNSTLDVGLDTFFQSSLITFKRRTFADNYPMDEVSSSSTSSSLSSQSTIKSNDTNDTNNNTEEMNNNHDKDNKLCPLSIADKIARSRSSPNLIDPRKMLLPGDPRHNLSMIKELRSRQKSGESTEISQTNNNNNLNHHSSLLSELKAKNRPFCSKKDAQSSVHKDKPPISLLKPSLKSFSPSPLSTSSSSSSSVQQSGQFFNVKLRETKPNKVNSLIKSYTRASFPVNNETDDSGEKVKRNSEPNGNQVNQQDNQPPEKEEKKDNSDSVSGVEEDKRLSKEASALNTDGKKEKSHRSSEEESSSSTSSSDEEEEEEEDEKKDNEDDNCHQNGTKSSEKISC